MVKIRLMRVGKRKQPSYRVVVADSRSPRDGRIIEAIGHYQPRQDPSVVQIDEDRALYWLSKGAQPSDQVRQLLRITGAWSTFSGEPPLAALGDAAPAATTTPKKATPAKSVRATPAASVADGDRDEGLESDTPSIDSTPTEDDQLSETGGASGGEGDGADGESSE